MPVGIAFKYSKQLRLHINNVSTRKVNMFPEPGAMCPFGHLPQVRDYSNPP